MSYSREQIGGHGIPGPQRHLVSYRQYQCGVLLSRTILFQAYSDLNVSIPAYWDLIFDHAKLKMRVRVELLNTDDFFNLQGIFITVKTQLLLLVMYTKKMQWKKMAHFLLC